MQKLEFQGIFDQTTNENTTSEGKYLQLKFPDHYHEATV